MRFSIITLFPELFQDFTKTSIIGRAVKKGLVEFELINLRDFGEGKHQIVDDKPYGGGVGMVLRPDILSKAIQSVIANSPINQSPKTILMSASGIPFNQAKAQELSKPNHLILVCGHYEGVDQRFIEKYVDEEISIGDYVLTGGEIPSMAVADAITRLIPGVLEKKEATEEESFSAGLLEYPQYTRPENFEGKGVPRVLLSGNHREIAKWRQNQALKKTKKVRPDLLRVKRQE